MGSVGEERLFGVRMHLASQGDLPEPHIHDELDHLLEWCVPEPFKTLGGQSFGGNEYGLVHSVSVQGMIVPPMYSDSATDATVR